MRFGTAQDALKAIRFLVLMVVVLALPAWKFLVYPVSILVSCDGDCEGVALYIDGRHATTITGKGDTLHFRYGWHVVEARKAGCKPATTRFHAVDSEQASYRSFNLTCKRTPDGQVLSLSVE